MHIPTKEERKLDQLIAREYYAQGDGVQINILSIPKIYSDCRRDLKAGESIVTAMSNAIDKYRIGGTDDAE